MRNSNVSLNIKCCGYCLNPFHSKRSNAKYYCSSCRAKAWKWRNDPELIQLDDATKKHIANLLFQIYKKKDYDFVDELENCIWAIESKYGYLHYIIKELEFRVKYDIDSDDYSTIIRKNGNGRLPTEADLMNYFGYVPKR